MSTNHYPYEEWLLAGPGQALQAEQAAELAGHLRDCPSCRALSESLPAVEHALRRAPMAAPRAGFNARWLVRVEAERQRSHRRQGLLVLATSLLLAAALLCGLAWLFWPALQAPSLLLWSSLYQIVRWLSLAGAVQQFLSGLLGATRESVPLAAWVLLAGVLCQLGVLWFVSYRVLTNPRRVA